jgi:hypothetical protein
MSADVAAGRTRYRSLILGGLSRLGTFLWGGGSLGMLALAGTLGLSTKDFEVRAVKIDGTVTQIEVIRPPPVSNAATAVGPSDTKASDTKASDTKTAEMKTTPPATAAGASSPAGNKSGVTAARDDRMDGAAALPKPEFVATIVYKIPGGSHVKVTRKSGNKDAFKLDSKVTLLVDPSKPTEPRVEGIDSPWTMIAVLGLLCPLFAAIGWALWPKSSAQIVDQWHDGKLFDYHPLNMATLDSYLSGLNIQPSGIAATATSIRDGKYPLALCEFAAYMSALVYEKGCAQ